MIKKEEKQFAFVGCCILCVCVAVGLLMLAFCVGDVSAITLDGYEGYTFEKSISATKSYSYVGDYSATSLYNKLRFVEIGYYDNIDYIRYISGGPMSVDSGAPKGASAYFSSVLGEGQISYSYNEESNYYVIYVFFDSFNRGTLAGAQLIDLNYNRRELYNISNVAPDTSKGIGTNIERIGFYAPYDVDVAEGSYYVQYGGYWRNDIRFEGITGNYYSIDIKKYDRLSKWRIWTDDFDYLNETTLSRDDLSFNTFETPVYINVTDVWGYYYDAIYTEAPPLENQLYGYVFDAADNFGIEGAFVEFQDQNMTTSDTGFYSFSSDTFGDSWLNLSKTGYQNFNKTIDYTGDQRYDIFLTKNETVNPGTCTVAGIVTNVTSGEPILNALVWIKNTTFSSYRYTNVNGYYVFYDLHNTTYTLSAEQDGYHKQQLDINLTDIDTAYYYDFALLAITDEEVPPTPTPKPPETLPEHVDNIFDMLGIEDWSVILAACVIMFMGGMFGGWSKYNPIVIMFGGFFGFLICIYMGLLPSWMLALVIVITVLLIVGVVARKYVGDE